MIAVTSLSSSKKDNSPGWSIESNVETQFCIHAPSTPDPVTAETGEPIDSAEIQAAVERIDKSRVMSNCARLIQLLRFVVDSTLKGEAMHLKETTIGVSVFGRTPDYDPKADTIVRSQAWRLRAKLKKYYESEGAAESIIIDLPIGHYVPTFRLREAPHAETDAQKDVA